MDPKTIAVLSGILTMIGWGLSDVFAKKAIDKIGHKRIMIYTVLPSLIVSIILLISNSSFLVIPNDLALIVLVALADLFAYLMLYKAYSIGKVSLINPISSAYTIPALIFSVFVFGEIISLNNLIFSLLIILGVIITSIDFKDLRDGFQGSDLAKGLPQGIIAALTWGLVFPLLDLTFKNNSWYLVTFYTSSIKIISLVVYNVLFLREKIIVRDIETLKSLFLAGITDSGANIAINWGLAFSAMTTVTTAISSTYPLLLIPMATLVLKEKNAPNQYLGAGLIVLGVVAISIF